MKDLIMYNYLRTSYFFGGYMKHRGFTMIEILIVIAIIAILAGLFVAGIGRFQSKSNEAICATEIKAFENAIAKYLSTYHAYPYDYDNFDGDPNENGNGGKDFGLDPIPYIESISDDGEREVAIANVCMYYALTYSNPYERQTAAITDLQNVRRKKLDHYFEFKGKIRGNLSPSELNEAIDGLRSQAYLLLDPWGNPYVFDENVRWRNSTGNNITLLFPDENDYVGRHFSDSGTRFHKDFDIWSFGQNRKNDPKNNGVDDTDPPNYLIDEQKLELKDDICSWNK